MSVQVDTLQRPGTCPRGFHACRARWRCPHGLTFARHTPTGKLQTASAGQEQGASPCPECTAQSEASAQRLDDAALIVTLNKALGLADEDRPVLAQGWLQITDGRPILEAKGLVTPGPEAR